MGGGSAVESPQLELPRPAARRTWCPRPPGDPAHLSRCESDGQPRIQPRGWNPRGLRGPRLGPRAAAKQRRGRCRQERVCRDGDWVPGFGGQTCGRRGGRSTEEGLPWGDPGLQGGVQGAGPRDPSANRASTNLTHRGICPGDPWAAVTPPGRRVEVPSPVRDFTRE